MKKIIICLVLFLVTIVSASAPAQVDELTCEEGTTKCGYPPHGACCARDQKCCAAGLNHDTMKTIFVCRELSRPCGRED